MNEFSTNDEKSLPRVFVSYTRGESHEYIFVKQLLARLDLQPLDPWDFESFEDEIALGKKIEQSCLEEINNANIFIPVVTKSAFRSKYVAMEIKYALRKGEKLYIAPIVILDISYDKPKLYPNCKSCATPACLLEALL